REQRLAILCTCPAHHLQPVIGQLLRVRAGAELWPVSQLQDIPADVLPRVDERVAGLAIQEAAVLVDRETALLGHRLRAVGVLSELLDLRGVADVDPGGDRAKRCRWRRTGIRDRCAVPVCARHLPLPSAKVSVRKLTVAKT